MRSYLLLLLCVTLWGANFVFGSILVREFPALHVSAYRLTLTTLFLLAYAAATRRFSKVTWRDIAYLIPLVLIGTLLNQVSFFTGLLTTDATTAALILSLAPIFTSILARVFLKEPFTARMAVGSVLALFGVFFVVGHGGAGLRMTAGIWLMFAAMITFSLSIILMRKLTERLDAFAATLYSTILGFAAVYPVAVWRERHVDFHPHWWAWALLFGSALLIQCMCSLIWNGELRKVGAAKASIFLNLQPFVAMVFGFVMLGTPITWTQVIGSVLIVGGVVLATWQGLPAPKLKTAAQRTEAP
ncbi:permease [Gordoniibacillus kamchatkensis]|uniref:Permease n=1 Tax=Gordoniibacillus kamchatkensis TaxID=1590651 RepID=A0ABR5AFD9_9BACL|nr:DMT family transporter [Paenibacillus sp. VKM B-2647]KIL39696.1 permease [Paenibacillus sp. VKM B-2647]